jgi:adenylate kinase family enzyme
VVLSTLECYHHRFMACPPHRIVVIGTTGSGKSVLAVRLARALGAAFVELDALHWEPAWTAATPDAFRARAEEATREAAWVVAGNYREVRDIVWPRACTIVWLDYAFPRVFWRLTARTLRRGVTREVLWNGNRENLWEHAMLWSERSLFNWLLKTYWRNRREYPFLFARPEHTHLEIARLRNPRETEAWLETFLGSALTSDPTRPGS